MILAIETATPHGSVALVSGNSILEEAALPPGRQASETIMNAVDDLFRKARSRPGDVRHVAVSSGPGSFTGLRVGMAAAKGFCFGWRIPMVPVPTLHALASRFRHAGTAICPVLDARKKEVYAAVFRWEDGTCMRHSPDMAIAPGEIPGILPGGTVFFCGDGAARFAPLLKERLGDRAVFSPAGEGGPSAGAVGILAAGLVAAGSVSDLRHAVPAYARPPEAEAKQREGRGSPSAPFN
ncbi:MAG: tRNA (adenosine(37)-N6)-threonylcarbamoyltransferase complex dimerization subunit type 1 TsaB [Deltaproteobacteria bacterium]